MFNRFVACAVAATLVSGSAVAAQQRTPVKPAQPPATPAATVAPTEGAATLPAPIVFHEELARWIPKDASWFVEVDDLVGALSAAGAESQFKEILALVVGQGGPSASLLNAPEMRPILSANAIVAEFPVASPKSEAGTKPSARQRTSVAGVVKMRNAETLAKVLPKFIGAVAPQAAKAKVVSTIHVGETDVQVMGTNAESGPVYATLGKFLVVGDVSSVKAVLSTLELPVEKTLAKRQEYVDGSNRFAGKRAVFGLYILPKTESRMPEAYESGEHSEELREMYARYAEANRKREAFFGTSSLKSFTYAIAPGETGLTGKVLFNIDPARDGVIPLLAKSPTISVRAAELLPGDANVFMVGGYDFPELYSLAKRSFEGDSDDEYGATFGPFGAEIAKLEKELFEAEGISLRDDFLSAFGKEVAYASGVARSSEKLSRPYELSVVEVVRPDFFRLLFAKFNETLSEESSERARAIEYKGAELWEVGDTAWAMIDGMAIGGRGWAVRYALDMRAAASTVSTSTSMGPSVRRAPRDVSGVLVMPAAGAAMLLSGGQENEQIAKQFRGGGLAAYATREPGGIAVEVEMRPELLGAFSASTKLRTIEAAGSGAQTRLRIYASAQAQYFAANERSGSIEELIAAEVLDGAWSNGMEQDGYRFTFSANGATYSASAVPDPVTETSKYSFFIDQSQLIRRAERNGAPATAADAPIGVDDSEEELSRTDYGAGSWTTLVAPLNVLYMLGSQKFRSSATVSAIYEIWNAEEAHVGRKGRAGSISELVEAGFLDAKWKASAERGGYRFEATDGPRAPDGKPGFVIRATPLRYKRGMLSYYASPSTSFRAADKGGAAASPTDPRMFGSDVDDGDVTDAETAPAEPANEP